MISLSISELKGFLSKASFIRSNNIMPIYDYVKIVCANKEATVIKANAGAFVSQKIEAIFKKDITFLIKEETLSAVLSKATGDYIIITVSEKKVPGADGKTEKLVPMLHVTDNAIVNLKFQSETPDLYPKIITPDTTKTKITNDVLESIFLAKNFTFVFKDDLRPWMAYVWIKPMPGTKKEFCVFGSDGHVMYYKKFKGQLPEMALLPNICTVIGRGQEVEYSTKENWDLFDMGNTLYGYLKPEVVAQEFLVVVNQLKSDDKFVFEKKAVLNWLELMDMVDIGSLLDVVAIQDAGKKAFQIVYNDQGRDVDAQIEVDTTEKTKKLEKFHCNLRNLLKTLKNFPYDVVEFNGVVSDTYYVTTPEDKNVMAAVRRVVYN